MLVYSGTQFDVKLGKNYSIDLLRTNLILNGFPYFFSGQHSGTRQACLETFSVFSLQKVYSADNSEIELIAVIPRKCYSVLTGTDCYISCFYQLLNMQA